MVADASIYSLIRPVDPGPGPLDTYAKLASVGSLLDQQKMNALQLQQAQRGIAEEDALKNLLSGNPQASPSQILSVSPKLGAPIIKYMQEGRHAEAQTQKLTSEVLDAELKRHKEQLTGVNDPTVAAQWIMSGFNNPLLSTLMQRAGSPQEIIGRIPQDPQAFQQWKMQNGLGLDKVMELTAPKITPVNAGNATIMRDLNPRSHTYNPADVTHAQTPDSQARTEENRGWKPSVPGPRGTSIQTNVVTGQERAVVPQTPASVQIGMGGQTLSPDALDQAAGRYMIDGTLPPNLGRGGVNTGAILSRAAIMAKEKGLTGEAARIGNLANKANSSALNDLSKRESQIGAFERTFVKNTDLVEELSKKVDRTGVPIVNKWINMGKRAITGDPDISAFDATVKGAVNEYTKIVSGSMGNVAMAEGEIKKIEGLLNAAQTPAQISEVIKYMKKETQNRMAGFKEQKAELMGNFGGNTATPTTVQPAAAPAAAPAGRAKFLGFE